MKNISDISKYNIFVRNPKEKAKAIRFFQKLTGFQDVLDLGGSYVGIYAGDD